MKQDPLFSDDRLPEGMRYQPDFLTGAEEGELLAMIARLPLREAQYKQYTAKRRIVSFGASYDFSSNELRPADPLPGVLRPLRERIGAWMGVPAGDLNDAMIAEYRPGTQLGWHRDVPDFEAIAGISLGAACRMRLRPWPPRTARRSDTLALELEPRSAYSMTGVARWGWQHAISPTKALRYSITFRTRAKER